MTAWRGKLLIAAVLTACALHAQDTLGLREARLRFTNIEARAIANFQSSDSIDARLHVDGYSLHPQIATLRLRLVSALNAAKAALHRGDLDAAADATARAEGLTERFARQIGGN